MRLDQDSEIDGLDAPMRRALEEIRASISEKYPTATFRLSRDPDEPALVLLNTILDLDDPDEVFDLVGERLLDLQDEERIPLHVIPLQTPERVLAEMHARDAARRYRVGPIVPSVVSSQRASN